MYVWNKLQDPLYIGNSKVKKPVYIECYHLCERERISLCLLIYAYNISRKHKKLVGIILDMKLDDLEEREEERLTFYFIPNNGF